MTRKKRYNLLYKALFTVNIEITEEPGSHQVEKYVDCTMKLESAHRFKSPKVIGMVGRLEERFTNYEYVEKNFPEAAAELFVRMLKFETLAADPSSTTPDPVYRNEMIKWGGKAEQRRIRRQIPAQKGRIKAVDQPDYLWEKESFLEKCKRTLAELETAKKSRTKTNLAKILYPRNENVLRSLRADLAKYGMTFGDLL